MSLIYPTIFPDFVTDLTLPDFGVSVQEVYGYEQRTFGTFSGIGTLMSFEYTNKTAQDLNTIMAFYHTCRGKFRSFNIPIQLWRHPDNLTSTIDKLLRLNSWRFEDRIMVSTVKADVYNFTVKFRSVRILISSLSNPLGEFFPCQIIP